MRQFENLKGKRILLTGHTGFKGSWLSLMLLANEAEPSGYALPPQSGRDNFVLSDLARYMPGVFGDILDRKKLQSVFDQVKPEIVIHLAAQPLVLGGYEDPAYTFNVNVQGTVNVLECFRQSNSANIMLVVTTDKVYEDQDNPNGYCETDRLGGHDPYSASKAAAELVAGSYAKSFFPPETGKSVCTVRAGNVIGGGDWSPNRIVPDCIRALEEHSCINIRHPQAIRPWQYVLEPLNGYLTLANRLAGGEALSGSWNFGPDAGNFVTVEELVNQVIAFYGEPGISRKYVRSDAKETSLLLLDTAKARLQLDWSPVLSVEETVAWTVSWYRQYRHGNMHDFCLQQINQYSAKCRLSHIL